MLLNPEVLTEISQKVSEELREGRYKRAAFSGRELSAERMASIVQSEGIEAASGILKVMDRTRSGRIISYMVPEFSAEMLLHLSEDERAGLLNKVSATALDEIFDLFPEEEKDKALQRLDKKLRDHVERARKYPQDSAGRYMSPNFLSVGRDRTVSETMQCILSAPAEIDRRPYVYVLDDDQRPVGVVSIKDLLRMEGSKKVQDMIKDNLASVSVTDPAVEAAEIIRNRRLMMLPVIGKDGALEGVLTFDDAMRILSEDALNLMTASASTYEESFFTPPMKSVKGRLPWMALNVFLNMGAVAVITRFEATIAQVAMLAAFIPMITDMGGNVGIQSLSVAIRSIALGEARLKDFKKLLRKETLIGLVNGMTLGVLFGIIAFIFQGNPYMGFLAGLALGVNVLVAGIVGGALPFLLKAFGRDPAMMTGPFLTTITDITGVSIYLGLSTMFLMFLL